MGNGYKIRARNRTECSLTGQSLLLLPCCCCLESGKKYVCFQDGENFSHKYSFYSLVLFWDLYSTVQYSMTKLPENTLSDSIK